MQLLQVVRGGQFPELRTRPTLDALPRLCPRRPHAAGLGRRAGRGLPISAPGRAPHPIPGRPANPRDAHGATTTWRGWPRPWVAPTCASSCTRWTHTANWWRKSSTRCWVGPPTAAATARAATAKNGPTDDLQSVLAQLPQAFAARVLQWREHPRVLALKEDSRFRLVRLVQRTGAWLEEGRVSEEAALRMADWIEPMLRRDSYLALLQERPSVHERLLRLLGAAKWPARYLLQHPGVIDELASQQLLTDRFDAAQFEVELESRRAALRSTGEDDEEALLNLLRRAHHAEVFRTLARDLEKVLTVEQVADDLSALADSGAAPDRALVLDATEEPPPRRAGVRHHWLRQARRQGTGLRQRSGHRVRLRRRARERGRDLRRLRAQDDQLAHGENRRGRPVRDRHRAAPQRQLGSAGHELPGLHQLPATARQQHRLDLGTPGHDARALRARRRVAGRAI